MQEKKTYSKKSTTNKDNSKKNGFKKDDSKKYSFKKDGFKKDGFKKDTIKKEDIKKVTTKKLEPTIDMDLFYMSPNVVLAKEIYVFLKEEASIQVDLWEDMNIMQVELGNKKTIEFEPIRPEFKDPSDQSFIQNRDIKSIYAIFMEREDFIEMKKIFAKIVQKFDGFICTDSGDFKPQYSLEELEELEEVKSDEYGME